MCLFCKIANHEIPASIVYEDEFVIAFLDIAPVTSGHTLIMPKKHYDDFTLCSSTLVARIHGISKILIKQYGPVLHPNGYNLLSNAHEAAGQSIAHVHFHLIPRYDEQDGLTLSFNGQDKHKLSDKQKDQLKIK
jgi:histidine triad (HIT) family protein